MNIDETVKKYIGDYQVNEFFGGKSKMGEEETKYINILAKHITSQIKSLEKTVQMIEKNDGRNSRSNQINKVIKDWSKMVKGLSQGKVSAIDAVTKVESDAKVLIKDDPYKQDDKERYGRNQDDREVRPEMAKFSDDHGHHSVSDVMDMLSKL